jgi:hypothetical protein
MSLKGFHIIFIVLSVLCTGGFWAWTRWNLETAQSLSVVGLGQASGVLGILLSFYGLWFIVKKSKTIIV